MCVCVCNNSLYTCAPMNYIGVKYSVLMHELKYSSMFLCISKSDMIDRHYTTIPTSGNF